MDILADATTAEFDLTAIDDDFLEGAEDVGVCLKADTSYRIMHSTGGELLATVALTDDEGNGAIDLVVDGLSEAEEESVGAFGVVNDDFTEGNLDRDGNPVPDNQPDGVRGHGIAWDDPSLTPAGLSINCGPDTVGTWSLSWNGDAVRTSRGTAAPISSRRCVAPPSCPRR